MTALVVNCIIGSGIFGVPSELTKLVGWASPLAMIVAGLVQAVIIAAFVEVASQFSEPGGAYLYVRTAFGRLAGAQVGWFSILAPIGGAAANATLFVSYLGGFWPEAATGWMRVAALSAMIGVPAIANCVGVRKGAMLSSALAVAKLVPLFLLIGAGLVRMAGHAQPAHPLEISHPGGSAWLGAVLLLIFAYDGYEDAIIPAREVKDPRRTIAFALAAGLCTCIVVYTLLQIVTVGTIGLSSTDRPLAETARVLIGAGGSMFVALAVMISTYGNVSAAILNTPRLAYALAAQGDFPRVLAKLHPRFGTPAIAIAVYSLLVLLVAATGTFLWALGLAAGSAMIIYSGVCAALIRLRRSQPSANAIRVPCGRALAVFGIIVSIVLLTRLDLREWLLMGATASVAALNWWWARRKMPAQLPVHQT
jgi:amino acid transporter